jgi:polygalacturonase
VTNCTVNSPWDDAICPKSSYALGYPRVTENLTIANCTVLGQLPGRLGDRRHAEEDAARVRQGHPRPIKFGTETNGGFRNITINNCTFEDSRGLAFETVDGGMIEDVTVSNLTMRWHRQRAAVPALGKAHARSARAANRHDAADPDPERREFGCQPVAVGARRAGRPPDRGCPAIRPVPAPRRRRAGEMAAIRPPENELGYPEATMFGDLPACGMFLRHMRNLDVSNIEIRTEAPDPRPAFWLDDVEGARFTRLRTPSAAPTFGGSAPRDGLCPAQARCD